MKRVLFVILFSGALSGLLAREWFGYAIERMCNYDSLIEAAEKSPQKVAVTSKLPNTKKYNYDPENLRDGDLQTAWCTQGWEKGKYKVDFVVIKIPKGSKGIRIINGYAKSKKAFQSNNRVKQFYLSFNVYDPKAHKDCEPSNSKYKVQYHTADDIMYLKDSLKSQSIIFSDLEYFKWTRYKQDYVYLGIGIVDVYPGKKWNDTCLTEVEIIPGSGEDEK